MLNINQANTSTGINFKSQRDFSQLYKEMEKITLTREEKIIPKETTVIGKEVNSSIKKVVQKINAGSKFVKNIVSDGFSWLYMFFINKEMFKVLSPFYALAAAAITVAIIGNKQDKNSEVKVDNTAIEHKTDSLMNLYQNKTISFEEFQKKYEELNKKD